MEHDSRTHEETALDRRMRAERPAMTSLQRDALRQRVLSTAGRPARPTGVKGFVMRSRLALASVLALGLLFSGTGATLALQGPSGSGSAGVNQYGSPSGESEVLGTFGEDSQNSSGGSGNSDSSGSDTSTSGGKDVAGAEGTVDAPRQLAAEDVSGLPFTGYAAIPILLIGLVLLASGLTLRRRAALLREHG
jgi:hypothetical protein